MTTLQTTFTPASSCLGSNNIWQIITMNPCPTISLCSEYLLQGPPSTSDCLPPGYGGNTIYYPGICPSGYSKACTSLQTVLETTTNVLDVGIYTVMTVQICCPTRFVSSLPFVFRGYIYPLVNTASFGCQSASDFDYKSTLGCFSPFGEGTEIIPVTVSQGSTTTLGTVTQSSPGGVNAYTIQVAVQISNSGTHPSTKANFPGMLS